MVYTNKCASALGGARPLFSYHARQRATRAVGRPVDKFYAHTTRKLVGYTALGASYSGLTSGLMERQRMDTEGGMRCPPAKTD